MVFIKITIFVFIVATNFISTAVYSEEYVVSSSYMELKTAAGRAQPIYTVVEKGESFSVVKQKTDWLKIQSINGDVGWVSKRKFFTAIGAPVYDEKKSYLASSWELGVAGGVFGSEDSYSVSAGYYVIPNLLLSAEMIKASGTYSSTTMGAVNLAINFYRGFIVSPFVNIGTGYMLNEPRQSLFNAQNETQTVYSYGGGFSVNPYKNMSIRFTVRDYYLTDKKENYYDWRIGIYGVFS